MSRCFPFPPPGYESQLRSDQVDLLTKEKHKEKHKKEKRDREKREGKERKDKDRSKDKHKEKKDRKEKHKDKKKEKEGHRDNNGTSEDRKNEEQIENRHEVKIGESSQRAEEVKDSRFAEELGRRIRDGDKGATNSVVEHVTGSIQRTKCMDASAAMEKPRVSVTEVVPTATGISQRRNDGMGRPPMDNFAHSVQRNKGTDTVPAIENSNPSNHMVAKLVAAQKNRNHEMAPAVDNSVGSTQERSQGMFSATVEKERGENKVFNSATMAASNPIRTEQRKNHGMARPVVNIIPRKPEGISAGAQMEKEGSSNQTTAPATSHGRNNGMGRPVDDPTSSVPFTPEKDRGNGNQMAAANHISSEQRRNHVMGVSVQKDSGNSLAGKEKTRDVGGENLKGDRHGDRDWNGKKSKGKDKDRHKEKEKEEEKIREKGEHKRKNDKPIDSGKKDVVDNPIAKPFAAHKDDDNDAVTNGKRKDYTMNEMLLENDGQPNKLMKTSSVTHLPLENGRALEPSYVTTPSILNGATNSATVTRAPDNKEHKINGAAEPRPPVVSRPKNSGERSENKVRLKPPHPDMKYLSQIYNVPKLEEWPEFDDQEWLFSRGVLRPKPNTKPEDEEIQQVWGEAMQIDSADVMALPYVIPF